MASGNLGSSSNSSSRRLPSSESYYEEPYRLWLDARLEHWPGRSPWLGQNTREPLYDGGLPPPLVPPPFCSPCPSCTLPQQAAAAGNGMPWRSLDSLRGFGNQHESSSSSAVHAVRGGMYPPRQELPCYATPSVAGNGWPVRAPPQPRAHTSDCTLAVISNKLHGLAITDDTERYYRQVRAAPMQRLKCGNGRGVPSWRPSYGPLAGAGLEDVRGMVRLLAKDRDGCRFLRRAVAAGGAAAVDAVFGEVVCASAELMRHPVGSGVMEDLIMQCRDEQITCMLRDHLGSSPGGLIPIAMDLAGLSVLERLIERIRVHPHQVSLFMDSLRLGCFDLITHSTGYLVIKKCLQTFPPKANSIIFRVAVCHCAELATDSYGCVVIQQCIDVAEPDDKHRIVAAICANGFEYAQDTYGNYPVQHAIRQEIAWANKGFAALFRGHYADLSKQKCSSHVVQRCLEFMPDERVVIVGELLAEPTFHHLIRHPFANYVIHTALTQTQGHLRQRLVEAIRPHRDQLRHNMYAKQIILKLFSRRR